MANIGKWADGANPYSTPTSLLTTEMNSLATGSATVASSIYNNQTNKDIYCDLFLHLASVSPTAGAFVTVYILMSVDGGTTFPSATAAVLRNQPAQVLTTIALDTTATTAQDIIVRNILIPPGQFKVVLDNQSGATLNAAGNTLKIVNYNYNLNG